MKPVPLPKEGRRRVIIEGVTPQIDCGRFAAKRVVGEDVLVEADIFTDGHDQVSAVLRYRHEEDTEPSEVPFESLVNDRWRGSFPVDRQGRWRYGICAWVDDFKTWQADMVKKVSADVQGEVDLLIGAGMVQDAVERVRRRVKRGVGPGSPEAHERRKDDLMRLEQLGRMLADDTAPGEDRLHIALSAELRDLMARHPDRALATTFERELPVWVDRERARFSAWYEFFPRSCGEGTEHGSFESCLQRLEYVAGMGFDIVYLPPIHPIGDTKRKGANNAVVAQPGEPGSPWAIGSAQGGHTSIHPELGDERSFVRFVERTRELGMEVALDIAFQVSPDHPWVREHPEWFTWRPDGTVQFAENPPKKYEDIYPLDFDGEDWAGLWQELKGVFDHWIERGVQVFRVDNPHTKAFAFWEWAIAAIKAEHPEVLFLSEAFTRPKVMYRLAKLGFSQSYTYFTWRNTKWEIEQYFTELTQTEVREFFRPNLWPNTPDILNEFLQAGGRNAFILRYLLAATLGASYGVYGPAFELGEHTPREPGSEEYLNSEKYEIRDWNLGDPESLQGLMAAVNGIRREHAALQSDRGLRFHGIDNESLICYSKRTPDYSNVVLMVVNLDPYHTHTGWTALDLEELGVDPEHAFQVHDLVTDARYYWQGAHNFVELDPGTGHIFHVEAHPRSETDFPNYV